MTEERFLWGAATSAHQVEGGNSASDWWEWEAAGNCEGGVISGAATDHWNRFGEDLKAAADIKLNSYRFSVEWARLEPEAGVFDDAAFRRYGEILDECERNGLVPMVTLHHFTLPAWVAKLGGIASAEFPSLFARFSREVVRRLGSRIPLWCTLNEPMVLSIGGYLGQFMPPARFSPVEFAASCARQLAAHVAAYDLIKAEIPERTGPFKDIPLQVGIAHNMIDFRASRAWHPIERLFASILHRFYNVAWLNAVTGKKPNYSIPFLVPKAPIVHEALGRRTTDFIGVNYYMKTYVQWRPKNAAPGTSQHLPIGMAFSRRGEEASDLGWAVHPAGLRRMLRVASGYGLPIYVTENGIADAADGLRPHYLRTHLNEIARARKEGIDIRGYYHWSLLDNFEWIKGFKPRFGLFSVNYDTFERTRTRSADLLRSIIAAHELAGEPWPLEEHISSTPS